MKGFITFALLLVINACSGQSDSSITFSRVTKVDSLSKATIYERVKVWSVGIFKNTTGALQMDDKESGLLAYDAYIQHLSPKAPKDGPDWKKRSFFHVYEIKLKVQIKDGRYKVEAYDIRYKDETGELHTVTSSNKPPFRYFAASQKRMDNEWNDAKVTIEDCINSLFNGLDKAIVKNDNW